MIVRLNKAAMLEASLIGVEGDSSSGGISEAEKIVSDARRRQEDGGSSLGVSGSNSGKGFDAPPSENGNNGGASMEKVVEEETATEGDDNASAAASGAVEEPVETEVDLKGADSLTEEERAHLNKGIPEPE